MSLTSPVNLLEYSNPSPDAGGWRSIFFKPSSRTLLLALLTIAATTWLTLRHEPWRHLSTFPIADGQITLTASGNLLSFSHDWADLYDGVTGRTINSILLNANFSGDRMVQSGDQFLVVPGNSTVAILMDLRSGSIQHLQVPVNPKDVKAIAAGPPRVLAAGADRRFASFYELHQLLPNAATQPTRLQAEAWWVDFSPDGRRILTLDPRTDLPGRAAKLTLVDGISGQIIAEPITGEVTHPGNCFVSPNWLVVSTSGVGGKSVNFDVYSATTGRRTHAIQIPGTGSRMMPMGPIAISDDGRLMARSALTGPTITLQIFDTISGAQVISRPTRLPPTFFPDSHRLLTDLITPTSRHLVVTDPAQEQPLAVLTDIPSYGKPSIRADGQMIALKL
ncbi:MAG: hypothetical protein JWN40_972, partial [Phycisphaerales bacterium]|nr:hypothetical protein [Phycisphaerales bacterium]